MLICKFINTDFIGFPCFEAAKIDLKNLRRKIFNGKKQNRTEVTAGQTG